MMFEGLGFGHVRGGEGKAVWVAGDTYTIKATRELTGGAYGLIEASIPPGSGPPPHTHTREDEAFYLLSGVLEITAGEQEILARTGDFVYLPRGTVHSFTNPAVDPARALILASPGGFEKFFAEAGEEARAGEQAPPLGPADFARLTELSRHFGAEIKGA
jgi:quercetin dioxygenase-like cupin family protein